MSEELANFLFAHLLADVAHYENGYTFYSKRDMLPRFGDCNVSDERRAAPDRVI
jgi:hypothetical protein